MKQANSTTTVLQQQLLDVVKANLPETVAGQMKTFLEEAENNKELLLENAKTIKEKDRCLKSLSATVAEKEKKIEILKNDKSSLKEQLRKCTDCERRYMELGYREQITGLKNQHAQSRVDANSHVLELVFKSQVYRKEISSNTDVVVKPGHYDSENNWVEGDTTLPVNKTKTETISEE